MTTTITQMMSAYPASVNTDRELLASAWRHAWRAPRHARLVPTPA